MNHTLPQLTIIDGRSGSGKTTLAAQLAARVGQTAGPAQLLHLDSLYPGWDGLAAGARALAEVLRCGHYQRYDWNANTFSGPRITLDRAQPLVIEGCGALTRENLAAARDWVAAGGTVRAIWLECDAVLRKTRALERDGEMFAPHWERWAAQEQTHFARHQPWLLADEVLQSDSHTPAMPGRATRRPRSAAPLPGESDLAALRNG